MKKYFSRQNIIIVLSVIAAFALVAYMAVAEYYGTHFFPGTAIGGADISDMTLGEAEAAVDRMSRIDGITVIEKNGAHEMNLTGADVHRVYPDPARILGSQEVYLWPARLSGDKTYGDTYEVAYDEAGLSKAVTGYLSADAGGRAAAANAYIDYDEDTESFVIIPDTDGMRLNPAALYKAVRDALLRDQSYVDLTAEGGIYYSARVKADDRELLAELNNLRRFDAKSVSIDMGAETTVLLNARDIVEFYDDRWELNEDSVREFVEGLAGTYDTYDTGTKREITTHNGGTKELRAYYGWQLNQDKTFTLLSETLREIADAADPMEISAVWKHEAASHGETDYGTTYVEVDMGEQNVYVYVDGELVIETPCVTGKYNDIKRRTPEGLYYIKYKQRNKTLTGYNPDGSVDYASFVNYWMPFNGGIGLHDATWRGTFGGSVYLTGGSHGCINLPKSAAAELYGIAYAGMPVICYY